MEEIQLQLATDAQLPIVAQLAKDIWRQWYPSVIGHEQVEYMLQKFYTLESLLQQKNEGKQQFYIVLDKTLPIGYVAISEKGSSAFFIEKFYVQPQAHNKGIGAFLMQKIVDIYKPKSLTLHVNRQNYIPINFYFKQGFKIERVADFDIGNGYFMNDFVMRKNF